MSMDPAVEAALRQQAEKRLKARRDLGAHILSYVLVNGFLVVIWYMTSNGETFFWPIFPLLGWGIGLAFNVWEVYSPEPSEARIQAEMDKLRRR